MATNLVTTKWIKGSQFLSDNPSSHQLKMYDISEDQNNEPGFAPKALMLSSLAGCSGLDVVSLLEKMRAQVSEFWIEVTGELTEEHPKTYKNVTVDYHFKGSDLQEDKIEKAVNLSVTKYCGVMEMFRQFANVKTAIHLHKS